MTDLAIVWFRRDLRLIANPALRAAAKANYKILALYIEDTELKYQSGAALNVFKHYALAKLRQDLLAQGLELQVAKGNAAKILSELVDVTKAKAIYWNRLYEPDAINRDTAIKANLAAKGLEVQSYNSSLIFEPWEISNNQDSAFKVFTAYYRRHLELAARQDLETQLKNMDLNVPKLLAADIVLPDFLSTKIETLELLPQINWQQGIEESWDLLDPLDLIGDFAEQRASDYPELRNRPDLEGVSKLSPYLALGMISAPMIYAGLIKSGLNAAKREYIRQLGWRDFAYHLIYHMPALVERAQRREFDNFPWQSDPKILKAWQQGCTGYPIVDAGMRELWHTGWMHNRVRMIVASFLVKDLLIDWREGAKWFWDTLVDADLANNTMGWQWAAGCGVDAAPYFRIFNPVLQGEKFDPDGTYVRRWVPELSALDTKWIQKPFAAPESALNGIILGRDYPYPLVDHSQARTRALGIYKSLK